MSLPKTKAPNSVETTIETGIKALEKPMAMLADQASFPGRNAAERLLSELAGENRGP